jgi:hypothetical protein
VLIHASKRITAAEYENAAAFIASIGVRCPHILSRTQQLAMNRQLPK